MDNTINNVRSSILFFTIYGLAETLKQFYGYFSRSGYLLFHINHEFRVDCQMLFLTTEPVFSKYHHCKKPDKNHLQFIDLNSNIFCRGYD